MFRCLIVDDESLARQKLRQLLAGSKKVNVAGEASSAAEARRLIASEQPDLLFLDIRMPGVDGLHLLQDLENPPPVIFVTAFSNYAVEAFNYDAVDYLVKPVRAARLEQALQRFHAKIMPPWQRSDRICFRTPERTVVAAPDSILALEADGDFTRVFIEGNPPLMICQQLGNYERTLPSPPLLRINRSLMINLEKVGQIVPAEQDHIHLSLVGLDRDFFLGRTARRRLFSALEK